MNGQGYRGYRRREEQTKQVGVRLSLKLWQTVKGLLTFQQSFSMALEEGLELWVNQKKEGKK